MTTLLIVRHGESTANLADLFAGNYDPPLTQLGHDQAECTAQFLLSHYRIDAVYSSDLQRAFQTAEHTARKLGLDVHADKALREISGGDWEARPYKSLGDTHPEEYKTMLTDFGHSHCPNGESVAEVADRVYAAICRIARENPGKTVLITTHATPVRVLQWKSTDQPLRAMQGITWVSNASVTEFFWDDGTLTAGKIGQDEHLAQMKTVLPPTI